MIASHICKLPSRPCKADPVLPLESMSSKRLWQCRNGADLVRIVQKAKLMMQLEECPVCKIAVHELAGQPAPPLLDHILCMLLTQGTPFKWYHLLES